MAQAIMLQGTSSHVGKSILTTALCRIFKQDGQKVTPFKAQNMALNSYVTKTGGEMGRAQVAQAEAAGLDPTVEMNPVLLKPTGNSCSQVIVMGKPVGNMSAKEYHSGYSLKALGVVTECLRKLHKDFDTIVIEGAGSPAEVNLKDNDIVNMRVAKLAGAPVLLIADIDRGGALASIVGTLELLEPDERDLVKGIIINKFRGDISLLKPALDFLEAKTGKPVIGVVPHLDKLGIDDEDSVSLEEKEQPAKKEGELDIAVLRLPKISNFTDFDALANESDVRLRYVRKGEALGNPDLIILPGSKNTTEDLLYLRENGYEREIIKRVKSGTPVVGICGGYQMLGREVQDPDHTESDLDEVMGLGLIDSITVFAANKVTHQVKAVAVNHKFLGINYSGDNLTGYEIHMGCTQFLSPVDPAFTIDTRSGKQVQMPDGAVTADGLVMGTYMHGIFDNDAYRRAVLDALRVRKGLAPLGVIVDTQALKDAAYNRLADVVRRSMDIDLVYRIMNEANGR
ncbi:cobyric acid synthase [Sporomusa acidovorans]|uniref:Cobyric acid synthase n=1 Tax=Sporomusa acidovorans (strain ATCC 49682 / DSM 3132 / Mol) TaxID=1123286 RepID=A0ABZ3J111_SPOA4|nr:cobyric acid synthase [Sporomusa acidovorans]OZC15058.1 cobyric acid synthase [Sporomusa acidovorans DSM 3132]SDE84814.1 adenosylcobyric acid synthase (glutamine-hydrolysing) [Sporomusa acidovorans]